MIADLPLKKLFTMLPKLSQICNMFNGVTVGASAAQIWTKYTQEDIIHNDE